MSPTPNHVLDRHLTVRVLLNARGEWEVVSPHSLRPHRYSNLDEATRAAYAVAYRDGPCELVVHDAYHRVVHAQHVEPGSPGGALPQAPISTAVAGIPSFASDRGLLHAASRAYPRGT
ncbi:MAG: hypothetical protein WAL38_30655 [Solirubrobacteraceae bacterium]